MKRGTPDHPKTKRLSELLDLKRWEVVGLLESLWHFASNYAKRGDIGKWSNAEIASHLEWSKCTPDELIVALVEARWLDECAEHRLLVHDWEDHSDQTVERAEEVKRRGFAKRKLGSPSASLANASQPGQSQSQSQSQSPARPVAEPKPRGRLASNGAQPAEAGKPGAGVFKCVTKELLQDTAGMLAWLDNASRQRKPAIRSSDANKLRVIAAAERALEEGDNPPALFTHIVSTSEWTLITQPQEERARKRLREHERQATGPPTIGQVLAAAIANEQMKA